MEQKFNKSLDISSLQVAGEWSTQAKITHILVFYAFWNIQFDDHQGQDAGLVGDLAKAAADLFPWGCAS